MASKDEAAFFKILLSPRVFRNTNMEFEWVTILFCILPNLGGFLGTIFVKSSLEKWYQTLKKPCFTPPDWVFGPVWTTLYILMGYASYLVYKHGGGFNGVANFALTIYGIQLLVNWAWSPLFFGLRSVTGGFYNIIILYPLVLYTTFLFYKINDLACYCMIPYIMWLTLATTISVFIYKDNKAIHVD